MSEGYYTNGGDVYNYNYENDVYQPRRSSLKSQLLQGVIGSLLGGGQLGNLQQLIPNRGYAAPYQQNYERYSPSYSPMYSSGYNRANNVGYERDYNDYAPEYSGGGGSRLGTILQILPVAEIIQQYTGGNGFLSSIVSNALGGSSYDEGDVYGGGDEYGYDDTVLANQGYQQQNGSADLISMLVSNVLSGV